MDAHNKCHLKKRIELLNTDLFQLIIHLLKDLIYFLMQHLAQGSETGLLGYHSFQDPVYSLFFQIQDLDWYEIEALSFETMFHIPKIILKTVTCIDIYF